jgi:UDP-glucose 4-epimerase
MNILLTGGAGFIGSHLTDALLKHGHRVCIIDDLSTGSLRNLAHLKGNPAVEFVCGSILDHSLMQLLVQRCDRIFHLAAAVGVQLIVDKPAKSIETNIQGTEVVLQLARRFGRKVIITSSSEVYGKNTKLPFSEQDDTTFGPTHVSRWSYACSKMIDEFLALAYHNQWGLETVICRLFNTVGPRQSGSYGMVVPRFVKSALAGKPLQIYGTGDQKRCFCNVADVADALMRLADCPAAVGQVVNIGTNEIVSVNELADRVIALTGSSSGKQRLSYEEAYGKTIEDLMIRVPDLTRIKSLIGFEPTYTLSDTLRQVIDFEKRGGAA